MRVYFNKSELYAAIEKYKTSIGYGSTEHSIDLISYCKCNDQIELRELEFSSNALRGIAVIGDEKQKDIILLNKNRSYIERNFDCGHEVIHLSFHRNTEIETFNCIENAKISKNPFYEWQANEGAAEFFLPYKELLPIIGDKINNLRSWDSIRDFKFELSMLFNVTYQVVEFRLESLKYEIHQYINRTPLDKIKIMSLSQQNRNRIKVFSLNDMEKEYMYLSIR